MACSLRSSVYFSQDTTRCIPAFRDTSDLYPSFPFDLPTQSDTCISYDTGKSALPDIYVIARHLRASAYMSVKVRVPVYN